MIMISKFLFNFSNFYVMVFFFTKLLTLGILFSTAVSSVFVAKVLTSGILFSNSVSFVFLTRSLTSGIFFSISDLSVSYLNFKTNALVLILFTLATNLLYTVFLQHHFLLHHLVYLNQQEQALIYRYPIYLLLFLN